MKTDNLPFKKLENKVNFEYDVSAMVTSERVNNNYERILDEMECEME